jgi:hypothetical protein
VQLAKDELTYKNWLIQQIKSYTKLDWGGIKNECW